MVNYSHDPINGEVKVEQQGEEGQENLKNQSLSQTKKPLLLNDQLDLCHPVLDDLSLSFADSFLDFDSIMADLGDIPANFSSNDAESGVVEKSVGVGTDEFFGETVVKEEVNEDGFCGELTNGGLPIEKEMEKVTLDGSNNLTSGVELAGDMSAVKLDCNNPQGNYAENGGGNGNEMQSGDSDNDDTESDSDSESESESSLSSSASSSSSSDEEDEDDEEESGDVDKADDDGVSDQKLEIEEGEIMLSDADEMVGWSDEEDEDGSRGTKGPIRSKNELQVLPPVPSVDVTLEPHHQIQPVGVVSSIIGAQVIVEGVEDHSPLNEGTILWITESKSALGIVDEVFGPVKNPYYIVRYNSEADVPTNILQGTLVSFVPEFANHVLNDKSVYQKGYDASNENDEELSDELEFSDDEKEAEYRRMLKMKKRGKNNSNLDNKRKDKKQFKNQSSNWKNDQASRGKTTADQPFVQQPVGPSVDQGPGLAGGPAMVPQFGQRAQAPGFGPPNFNWTNGFPAPQLQNTGLPLPGNGIPWLPQTHPQQLFQMPWPTGVSLQNQTSTIPRMPFNFILPGRQPGFGGGPSFPPWMDQSMFNQSPFGMGLPGQQASLPINTEGQPIQPAQPNGPQLGYDPNLQQSPVRPNGRGRDGGGRNLYQNRGGRFGQGRGRQRGH